MSGGSTANAVLAILVALPEATPAQRAVAVYLVSRANGRRFCWVSHEEIQADTGISTRHTICSATKLYAEAGLIRVERRGRGRNHYYIADRLYDEQAVLPSGRLPEAAPGVQKTAHPIEADVQKTAHPDVQKTAHPTLFDVQKTAHQSSSQVRTSSKTPPLTPPKGGKAHDAEFEEFWNDYPKKRDKEAARRAFKRAMRATGDIDPIITALWEAKDEDRRFTGDEQFIPYPASWLNAQSWEPQPRSVMPLMEAAHAD
jgi:hypothetical protein